MKKNCVHPIYARMKVTCAACGNVFETRSTLEPELTVDICSNCHPVYSGKRSELTRSSDRVDQFRSKYGSFLLPRKRNIEAG